MHFDGTVHRLVRITAQLIDATNGAHLWADRFDGDVQDVLELQDNVAGQRRWCQRANVAGRRDQPMADRTILPPMMSTCARSHTASPTKRTASSGPSTCSGRQSSAIRA